MGRRTEWNSWNLLEFVGICWNLLEFVSMPSEVLEHILLVVLYCLNLDEKFEPPSCLVEAFRGEGDYVDWVLLRRFEVFDPPI